MKKGIVISAVAVVLSAAAWLCWEFWASPTRIALLNFQNFQAAKMLQSADSYFVKVDALNADEVHELKKYDAVLVFAMGLRITEEQRAYMKQLSEKGTAFYSFAVTSPENDICNLDSIRKSVVEAYLANGGSSNYRSLFHYVRRDICGKRLFSGPVLPVKEINPDCLFHIGEDLSFNTVEEYETYLREKGLYREGQKKIALLTGIAGPFNTNTEHLDSIIVAFQNMGYRMYPVASFGKRMEFLEEILPDAVIYLPHGRISMGQGDRAVEWFKKRNIPVFCPLTLNATYRQWLADKQGMSGGFLSQSLVMPELDGGILPYALIAQYEEPNGIFLFKTIPERLEKFCRTVENYLELKDMPNSEKKVAVYYFKGPGSAALNAAGLEVLPSLYGFLRYLKQEGYDVSGLPETVGAFETMVMEQGPVFNSYAEGSMAEYLSTSYPRWVGASDLDAWLKQDLPHEVYSGLIEKHGPVPGDCFVRMQEGEKQIAVTCIRFGNVVLLPQPVQGTEENSFQAVHGSNPVPPYPYIASYLWVRHGFGADAMLHFGTHGSLEFIPGKQVALSSEDWSDLLVGDIPHFYLYTIANVGEGMIAKRRTYATTITYLNPPFMESGMENSVKELQKSIRDYLGKADEHHPMEAENLKIKRLAVKMGLHRDLELDSNVSEPYSIDEIQEIDNYATELVHEKIGSGLYTLGVPFEEEKILSSVRLMMKDPLAFGLAEVDVAKGKIERKKLKEQRFFAEKYYSKAEKAIERMLSDPGTDVFPILQSWGISEADYRKACVWGEQKESLRRTGNAPGRSLPTTDTGIRPKGHPQTASSSGGHPAGHPGSVPSRTERKTSSAGHPDAVSALAGKPALNSEEADVCQAIYALKSQLEKVDEYRQALYRSPAEELASFANALSGGYVAPTSGGDFIANPSTLPTGRNLYAINAETTPTAGAWEKGKKMGEEMLADYARKHGGAIPAKVSFTLWSGSFIESEGATLAQIFYLLGVEPVWDRFGRVLDVRLIPQEVLQRPRVDVVVQTSGQFRDLAASRLELLQRAIVMAGEASDKGKNFVAEGKRRAEALLLEKGYSPKEARELSTVRVFGGLNGMAGTGITGMVQAGDRWEKESEIAETYLHNMGAMYGSSQGWGDFREGLFEAALQNTDVVVQPRQSNTWGALSLDHVYEFMGGLTLTVRNVTGKDPDNYFNDLRNRYNVRVQDLRSAIGVEARTTFFNPKYIRERMKGGASSAAGFTELVSNTYGWNVMKPSVIDNQMWNRIYDVYIKDVNRLGIRSFFERESPASLQEITAVMMETARKGYWKASAEQLADLAELHAELVEEYGACCNGFTCGNALLKDFISQKLPPESRQSYRMQVRKVLQASPSNTDQSSVVLEKETSAAAGTSKMDSTRLILLVFGSVAVSAVVFSVILVRKRRKSNG